MQHKRRRERAIRFFDLKTQLAPSARPNPHKSGSTIMVMVRLNLEKQGTEKLASHAFYTFWYVIPTMPMFLLLLWLLHKGTGFWWCLLWSALLTCVGFLATALVAKRFGVDLIP